MVSFNDADDFMSTMAEGGNKAYRFEDIDGIGPKTANKIKSVRGVNAPTDVADMSADELSDKAGISHSRATKAIKAGGGNPNQSKQNSSSLSNISTAGMTRPQGDFQVPVNEIDKARAKNDTMTRSEEAIKQDDRKRAPVTTDLNKWANNKAKFDYPGVDTPTQEPNLLPKDVKQDDKPETTDFEARDEQIKERNELSFPRTTADARGNEGAILETGDDRESVFTVMREVPDPDPLIPGTAPSDFEDDAELPAFDTEAQTMGALPSAQRLPKDDRENLAEQAPTDVLAMQGQQQSDEPDRREFEFPDWTLSRGRTYLNKKVYEEDRDDLNDLRERISVGEPLELTKDEYDTFQRVVREGAQDELESLEGMEANIFGDAEEQREIAREAKQGIINNPPSFSHL
jgi:hypothetical protein